MAKNPSRKSIATKILAIVLLSIFLLTALLGYMSFQFSKMRLVSMLGDSVKGIASTVAIFLHGERMSIILDNSDKLREKYLAYSSAAYSHIYEKTSMPESTNSAATLQEAIRIYSKYAKLLSDIKKENNIDSPINVYAVEKNRLKLILTSDPVLLLGTMYQMRPEAESAVSTGIARSTGIYKDKDGTWISAYAVTTYADSNSGKIVVEINHKVDAVLRRLGGELGIIIVICVMGFLLAAVISYRLIHTLASNISKLDAVAIELEREHYNIPIDIRSDDEIGHLAGTFDALRTSIKDKIEELRLALIREKRAHLESIVALTNAIEMRDPYTKEHLERVEKYAFLIAKAMHLSKDDMQKLRYSCFLHDIGKIYVETALMHKVKLSPEDYEEIKKHSERGAKIIEGIQFLTDVKDAVLYHQERYDGKGYPNGLKGTEIPLLARIVSVADAFDAMTSERPYKKKMSLKQAMIEIEKNAGTQFDPEVCKAFLKYRDEIEGIAKKHFKDFPA